MNKENNTLSVNKNDYSLIIKNRKQNAHTRRNQQSQQQAKLKQLEQKHQTQLKQLKLYYQKIIQQKDDHIQILQKLLFKEEKPSLKQQVAFHQQPIYELYHSTNSFYDKFKLKIAQKSPQKYFNSLKTSKNRSSSRHRIEPNKKPYFFE